VGFFCYKQDSENTANIRYFSHLSFSLLGVSLSLWPIFHDYFKSVGQNVRKHTLFERIFILAPNDAIPAENNSFLTMLSAEMTFRYVKFSGLKVWNGLFYRLPRGSNKHDITFIVSLVKTNY